MKGVPTVGMQLVHQVIPKRCHKLCPIVLPGISLFSLHEESLLQQASYLLQCSHLCCMNDMIEYNIHNKDQFTMMRRLTQLPNQIKLNEICVNTVIQSNWIC